MGKKIKAKPQHKGFRLGVTKEDILDLTEFEKKMIQKQREFNSVKTGSRKFMVLLQCDDVRRKINVQKNIIGQSLIEVKRFCDSITKANAQLMKGVITDELRPGIPLTVNEMERNMAETHFKAEDVAKGVVISLAELSSYVGSHDVMGNVLMPEEDFEQYVDDVDMKLKDFGYDIFDEEVRKHGYRDKPKMGQGKA